MNERKQVLPIPRRHLVHDEIETFPPAKASGGRPYRARVRIWRAKELAPVVLVSQVEGEIPPSWLSSKLVNYCHAALLGYGAFGRSSASGLMYFEDEEGIGNSRRLSRKFFEFSGTPQRLVLFNPESRAASWAHLEHLVDEPVPQQ